MTIKAKKTTLLLLLISLLYTGLGYGQGFNFRHLSVAEGLSQSAVLCTAQDDKGYIWVGTADGLNKFNGYEFSHFRNRPGDSLSISDNFIYAIEPAKKGGIWVGTLGGGLNYFNPELNSFERWPVSSKTKKLTNEDVYCIMDLDSALLVGTYAGLEVSYDGQKFERIGLKNNFLYTPRDLLRTQRKEILVAHDYGLSQWEFGNGYSEVQPKGLKDLNDQQVNVHSLCQMESGEIWVGTETGLFLFDEDYNPIRLPDPLRERFQNTSIASINQDALSNIWIGTKYQGLSVWLKESQLLKNYRADDFDDFAISDDEVTSIFQDNSGVVWIGTYNGGLNQFNYLTNQFRLYQHKPNSEGGIQMPRVFAIEEDKEGNVWVGMDQGGINKVNHKIDAKGNIINVTFELGPEAIENNSIWSIEEDNNGVLWIGSIEDGLFRFNPKNNRLFNFQKDSTNQTKDQLSDNSIYSLLFDSKSRLWIGTDDGLNMMDTALKTFRHFAIDSNETRSFSSNTVLAIEEDKKGNIWVGTFGGGISVLNPEDGTWTRYKHHRADTNSLSYDKVMSIYKGKDDDIWVGTFGGGFNLFDEKSLTFSSFTELDGLANDVVYGFLEDENGYLWMSTNKGLSAFHKETGYFRNYDVSCNLQSNEFNQGAYEKGKSGRFYFGGIKGFNSFNPITAQINSFKPPIDIIVSNKPNEILTPERKDNRQLLSLDYEDNHLFVQFVAFNYINSHLNQYRYKLEGHHSDWIEAGFARSVNFSNLPPGDYTFKVQASNNDGVWNMESQELEIEIASPIYLLWWFQPAMFILAIIFILSIALLIVKNIKTTSERQLVVADLKLAEAEKESFENKLISLRAQMDPHFIFNSLNSIQHFISQNDKNEARNYLTKFASLMRMILSNSREETLSLAEELDTLKLYIDLESLRFDHMFDYELDIDKKIDPDEAEIPTMLLQPYVENAIIHGLKNKVNGKGLLSVSVLRAEAGIQVTIEDNGIGRAAAKEIRSKKLSKYKSLGMQVTHDRLKLWSRNRTNPTVIVTDLYNSQKQNIGTRVEVFIKVSLFD